MAESAVEVILLPIFCKLVAGFDKLYHRSISVPLAVVEPVETTNFHSLDRKPEVGVIPQETARRLGRRRSVGLLHTAVMILRRFALSG